MNGENEDEETSGCCCCRPVVIRDEINRIEFLGLIVTLMVIYILYLANMYLFFQCGGAEQTEEGHGLGYLRDIWTVGWSIGGVFGWIYIFSAADFRNGVGLGCFFGMENVS